MSAQAAALAYDVKAGTTRPALGQRRTTAASRRTRLALADVLLPAIFALCVVIALAVSAATPEPPLASAWTSVRVEPAGTLWALAHEHPLPGRSTAEVVEIIRARNGLTSASLVVGQSIEVPALAATPSVADSR